MTTVPGVGFPSTPRSGLGLLWVLAAWGCESLGIPGAAVGVPPAAKADPVVEAQAWGYRDDPAEMGVDPAMHARAQVLWDTRCARCHGRHGDGRGEAAEVGARDFHPPRWQASTADAHIREVIVDGGEKHGLAAAMPPTPGLETEPQVLDALIEIVRRIPHYDPPKAR